MEALAGPFSSNLRRAASSYVISPPVPSDGGEGRGDEERSIDFPSSVLSPLVPRRERIVSLVQPGNPRRGQKRAKISIDKHSSPE